MWPFSSGVVVPVLRLSGTIGMVTPLRPGLSLSAACGTHREGFLDVEDAVGRGGHQLAGRLARCNRSLIFRRIRQLAEEKEKKVYVFCEDVAASGGYYLALAGDEIYADPSSIVGSIGVISASFGLDKAIEKLGVERRVYTAGTNKGSLDPFLPEKPDDVERLKAIQRDVHDVFIGVVKERRAGPAEGAGLRAVLGRLLVGAKGAGIRAHRRHRRRADARCASCTATRCACGRCRWSGGWLSRAAAASALDRPVDGRRCPALLLPTIWCRL